LDYTLKIQVSGVSKSHVKVSKGVLYFIGISTNRF